MKVSRREFYLLLLLLCVGIGYLLYVFVYSPMLSNILAARAELLNSQARMISYQQMIATYDIAQLEKEQQAKLEQIEESAKPLLPHIDDGEIAAFIDQLAQSQSIRVFSVVFNPTELYDTATAAETGTAITYPLKQAADDYKAGTFGSTDPGTLPAEDTNSIPPEITQIPTVVNRRTVEIQLNGVTYPQIIGFIKQLEASGRAIYLTGLSISEGEGGVLSASLVYGFIQAEKLTDADKGLADVPTPQSAGKTDPFIGG